MIVCMYTDSDVFYWDQCCVCVCVCVCTCVCVCVLFGLLKRERGGGGERGERESARVGRRLSASSANGQPSIHACSV